MLDLGAININFALGNFLRNKVNTDIQLSNMPKLGEQIKSTVFFINIYINFHRCLIIFSLCFFFD